MGSIILAENKERLLDSFIETCVDFSFKTKTPERNGVLYGQTSSGEQIAILHKGNISSTRGVPISTSVAFFTCSRLYNFNENLKRQIMSYLTMLAQDLIGCKLLRIVTAKFAANQLPKIIFVPTDQDDRSFYFCENQYAEKILEEAYHVTLTGRRALPKKKQIYYFSF